MPPPSGQGAPYEPTAKSAAAQRESEGLAVPTMAVQKNAAGGKGPCGGQVAEAGRREGRATASGPNHPGGRKAADKARRLQLRPWAAAKRSPERRFHALYDHIARGDVLAEAWKRVRANRGASGVDEQTLDEVPQHMGRFLEAIRAALTGGTYRAEVVPRRYIPRPTEGSGRWVFRR